MKSKFSWKTSHLKAMYFLWSKIYDSILDSLFSFDRKQAVKSLNVHQSDRVLEIGVGTGLNLPLYPEGCKVFAIDVSETMIAEAKKKNVQSDVSFRVADARKLHFSNETFDKAMATFVLRVTPKPQDILLELARVVKTGGTVILVDHFRISFIDSILDPLTFILGWGRSRKLPDFDSLGWLMEEKFLLEKRITMIKLRRL